MIIVNTVIYILLYTMEKNFQIIQYNYGERDKSNPKTLREFNGYFLSIVADEWGLYIYTPEVRIDNKKVVGAILKWNFLNHEIFTTGSILEFHHQPTNTFTMIVLREALLIFYDSLVVAIDRMLKPILYKDELKYDDEPIVVTGLVYIATRKTLLFCGVERNGKYIDVFKGSIYDREEYTISVFEGVDLRIACLLSGANVHLPRWSKNENNKELIDAEYLTLTSVKSSDEGIYLCTGTGLVGNVTSKIKLYVMPRIAKDTWNVSQTSGNPAKLLCLGLGHFNESKQIKMNVSWSKHGEDIEPGRFQKNVVDNSLTILDTEESDSGNYTCRIQSALFATNTTITLVITPRVNDTDDGKTVEGNTALFLSIGIPVALIFGICVFILTFYYLKINPNRLQLSKEQIDKFFRGSETIQSDEEFQVCTNDQPYDTSYELPLLSIALESEKVLGQGEFGVVYKGVVRIDDKKETVAFKTTKPAVSDEGDLKKKRLLDLLSELKLMIYIGRHPSIIRLVGAYTQELKKGVVYVAMEFCPNGSLEKLLKESNYRTETLKEELQNENYIKAKVDKPQVMITDQLLNAWPLQIARGMEYVSSKRIVHSDLATRNVLVSSDLSIRITDFGLSRRLEEYKTYVKMGEEERLPWRWMALESLEMRKFSTESDVWSFGVTIWEIYSKGCVPYPGESWSPDFSQLLRRGYRLPHPSSASVETFCKLQQCWSLEPSERPTFNELAEHFQKLSYKQDNILYV